MIAIRKKKSQWLPEEKHTNLKSQWLLSEKEQVKISMVAIRNNNIKKTHWLLEEKLQFKISMVARRKTTFLKIITGC